MNPILIYQKIEALFGDGIDLFPLRFATDPRDLPEDAAYVVCAVSLQAMPDLEANHTAEATIEFSLVIPISENIDRRATEDLFTDFLNELYKNMFPEALNDADDGENRNVTFYEVSPESVPAPEHDNFRIVQSATFKASVQF